MGAYNHPSVSGPTPGSIILVNAQLMQEDQDEFEGWR